ncbi:MAG TPA: prolipoprotein diacylglyceryl transferase [Candidatus Moranbacteria bacterium]|nr:prolipoprotein diacylglyceryl transferase [Candidatus Moranbacteria bacterium]
MDNFLYFYQHLPYNINPTAFSLGFFRVDWYSLMYIFGFLAVYLLLKYRIKREEIKLEEIFNSQFSIFNKFSNQKIKIQKKYEDLLLDLLSYSFLGLIIGARLGYVLFYNFSYYWSNPLAIISPLDSAMHQFIGIYGMSYHGGLIGVILVAWIFARKNKINFFALADFVVPAIPAGYFFGRLGNFLNGELYGRVTEKFWGMYFPSDALGILRHPSQIYEAILEGIILFLVLWTLRNNEKFKDKMLGLYLLGYAICRIIAEFFREPDSQIGYIFSFLTLGQILSGIMLFFGALLIFFGSKLKKC